MKVLVLNPNTTKTMTDSVLSALKRKVDSSVELIGLTASTGCAVIDSRDSYAIGAQSAMSLFAQASADVTHVVLACFGDPGLDRLYEASKLPVIGLAKTAFTYAAARNIKAAVITIGEQWGPMLHDYMFSLNIPAELISIYALKGNGKKLIEDPDEFRKQVFNQSVVAAEQGASILFLGGAAFADLTFEVDPRLELIDVLDLVVQHLI